MRNKIANTSSGKKFEAPGHQAVKRQGGVTVVQNPDDALFPDMPRNAMKETKVDCCPSMEQMPGLLVDLVRRPLGKGRSKGAKKRMVKENRVDEMKEPLDQMEHLGHPWVLSCPQCNGVLWELRDGEEVRYRCRVGHAFSPVSLRVAQSEAVEA